MSISFSGTFQRHPPGADGSRNGCRPGIRKKQKGDLQSDNKGNGHSTKTLKSQYGEFQTDVPRDRNGESGPKLVPKYQGDISGTEKKVISLYAGG